MILFNFYIHDPSDLNFVPLILPFCTISGGVGGVRFCTFQVFGRVLDVCLTTKETRYLWL